MYHAVRKIHLYCGLIILAFLMMYFVSGYMMAHRPWFLSPGPAPTTRTATFQPGAGFTTEQLAAEVQKQLRLPGRIQFPQKQPAGMTRFWVNYPGTMARVDVPAGQRSVTVTTQRAGLVGTLIMLHKVNGYDGNLLFDACALFCDLAGLSMILFALSGVYLWWKRVKHHTWGILCLAASCAYAVGMMLYLAYAP
jgi:hypothetical protein